MKCVAFPAPKKTAAAVSLLLHACLLGLLYATKLAASAVGACSRSHAIGIYVKEVAPANDKPHPLDVHAPSDALAERGLRKKPIRTEDSKRNDSIACKQPRLRKQAALQKRPRRLLHGGTAQIDARGLYAHGQQNQPRRGATLELVGWTWDSVPSPKDTTEECGKLVFEIKVDENGEVLAVRTLEKTVSPLVEKIYADALRGLTFSKTSSIASYAPTSTGKVRFVLVAK